MNDVVVIGGGPAGLTLGSYLARSGHTCLILEKEHHPRPHVGESLMPSAVRILREIGAVDVVDAAGFPRSGGVVYHPQVGFDVSVPYRDFPGDGADLEYTYQVDRARFDMLLMKHAVLSGCDVVEGAVVEEVAFDGDRATGVRARVGGESVVFPASVVVDAGGRDTLLGRQLDLRHEHGTLEQFALHTWWRGVDRGRPRTAEWTHIFFLPDVRGWAWLSPINDELTSVGVVASRASYREAGQPPEAFLQQAIRGNRKLARATHHGHPISQLKGEVNYSYRLDRVCGDGWVALGDAARFIDPVFSSGVAVAMHSARHAATVIAQSLEAGDTDREALFPYEDRVLAQGAMWDDFTRLFYRLLPGFTHLLESREHRSALLQMIQGDVLGDAPAEVLDELRSMVRSVETADTHPWKDQLLEYPF